ARVFKLYKPAEKIPSVQVQPLRTTELDPPRPETKTNPGPNERAESDPTHPEEVTGQPSCSEIEIKPSEFTIQTSNTKGSSVTPKGKKSKNVRSRGKGGPIKLS
ncbi:hypothetical protein PTTG_25917, partial [Puccinia triticina 1-1 BBBD Race 1]